MLWLYTRKFLQTHYISRNCACNSHFNLRSLPKICCYLKMSTIFLLCCFLAIAFSDGVAMVKSGEDAITVTDGLHKISKMHIRDTELVARQDNSACLHQLQNDLPSYCNFTLLSVGISGLPASSRNDAQLAVLNRAYSQICVPACIDPLETYYNCIQITDSRRNYFITFIRKGVCGQESGDYCVVRYIRQYNGNTTRLTELIRSCPSTNSSGISCSGASSTCLSRIGTFSSRMGCCTEPYLGSGVQSCSGISVDAACTGVSGAAVLAAPVFMMVFALIGFLA